MIEFSSMYNLAVLITAPLETRLERIKQRTYEQYGDRIRKCGDMYDQHLKFIDFVTSRSLSGIDQWSNTLKCPLLHIDGTKCISENIDFVIKKYIETK